VNPLNRREHWSKRHERNTEHQARVRWALGPQGDSLLPCIVTLTRISPRTMDDDGNVAAFKWVRDEVARWLGADDSPRSGIVWCYKQQRGEPKQYAVRIEIESDKEAA
jgi:hypothetical protein